MPIKGAQGGGSGKAGASDVRAGGAFVEIFGKDNLTKTLDSLKKRVTGLGSMLRKAGGALTIGGAALGAGPLGLLLGGTDRLAKIGQMAREFEAPIEVMGRLAYAAEVAGVSIDEVMKDKTGRFQDLIDGAPLIDADQVRLAEAAQKDFRDATISLQLAMMPLLETLGKLIHDVAEFAKKNAGVVRVVGMVAAAVTGLGVVLSGAGVFVGVLVAGIGLLAKGLVFLMTPIGAVLGGLAGLVTWFATTTDAGRAAMDDLGAAFVQMGETFQDTWGGLVDAVTAGDLELAFKILAAGVKTAFFDMLSALAKALAAFLAESHRKLVALATIAGALKGGAVGGRFGGLGLLIGGIGGGAAAGLAADAALGELEAGLGGAAERMAGKADAARAELAGLRVKAREAVAAAKRAPIDGDMARKAAEGITPFEAVKGAFNVSAARQQFGYGDKASEQTELQKRIEVNTKKTAEEVAKLFAALRFT